MKLREHQAKAILASRCIRVPRGKVVSTVPGAEQAARSLGGATVIKPQLGMKGRAKVGGIGFAENAQAASREAARLLGSCVRGEVVQTLLVEERVDIERELYLAVAVDYAARRPVLMASSMGGVDIEEVARTNPEAILRIPGSMLQAPSEEQLLPVRHALGAEATEVLGALYEVFRDYEAELVEVNPVAVTPSGLVAVDAVLNVNDPAIFRHAELQELRTHIPPEDPLAEEAAQQQWTYIDLGGDIAILSSGAGLTMTIVDLIARQGATAANFLDTAQIDEKGMYEAFELLRRGRTPKVWLVNIFAGLNRCDRLAEGMIAYLEEHPLTEPLVVRMVGNFEEEGHRLLSEQGIEPVLELEVAVERCVDLATKGGAS